MHSNEKNHRAVNSNNENMNCLIIIDLKFIFIKKLNIAKSGENWTERAQ